MEKNKKIILLCAVVIMVLTVISLLLHVSGLDVKRIFLGEREHQEKTGDNYSGVTENNPKEPGSDADSGNGAPPSGRIDNGETSEDSNGAGSGDDSGTDKSEGQDGNNMKKWENIKVKAVYLTGPMAGNSKVLDHFVELVKNTELNALVIDLKEGGIINYESNVPEVRDNNLYRKYYNIDEIVKKLHDNGIFVIGRIVCFRDNGLAAKRPELAIKKPDGTLWKEGGKGAWTNPYKRETWDYNIAIAKEAVEKGFDEIQFDYVRFPTAKKNEVYYGDNPPSKADAICGFLKAASDELHKMGVPVSADVFGIIAESVKDGLAIGQDLDRIGLDIDYICPMVYPSHYANASNGIMGNGYGQSINGVMFTAPDLKPYEVVYNTLIKTKDRISKVENYKAKVRPYLQDFTATYLKEGFYQKYGPEQVRQQIKAVYDAGYDEWILWNGRNIYSEGALIKESGE